MTNKWQTHSELHKKDKEAQYAPSLDTIRVIQYLKRHDKPNAKISYWTVAQALGMTWRSVMMCFTWGVVNKGLGYLQDQGGKRWNQYKQQWQPYKSLHLTVGGKNIQWPEELLQAAMVKTRQMKRAKGFDMGEMEVRPALGNSRVKII